MRHLLLFLSILMLVIPGFPLLAQTMPAEGTVVADVRVEGTSDKVTPEQVIRAMELRPGSEFSREAYRRDLQSISNLGTVDPLALRIVPETTDAGLVLVVQVKENPTINEIQIIGNIKYSRRQILSQLPFKEGDILPTGVRASTARNLNSFYQNAGYKDVRVNVTTTPRDENTADLVIMIDERQRIKIDKLILNGNTHFKPFFVKTRLVNSPGILFFKNYFDEMSLNEDVALLRTMYENAGFLDASVKLGEVIYDEEDVAVSIVHDIVEGPRYRVSEVATEGVSYFTEAEIGRITDRLVGKTFKGTRLQTVLDRMKRLYGDQGYIDTEVSYRLDKTPEDAAVRIVLMVAESSASYVGEIRLNMEDYDYETDVTGFNKIMNRIAPRTKEETVLREVRLKSGEKYRTSDEVRTTERLRNLGIFRKVEVQRDPTSDPAVKDVTLNIEENPNAAFVGVTAGIGEYSGPSVTFRLSQPNWNGEANRLSASATFGTRTTAYRIGYFERYIGDSDTSMEVALYRTTERFRAYRQRIYGSELEFGRPLDKEYLYGYLRFRAEHVKFPSHTDTAEEDFDSYPVFAVRPMLVYDRRDNSAWPTRGYLIGGGFETGYADGFLFKMLHDYEWYHQFERSEVVYAYKHTVGLMPYDADKIGISERFFVGGTSTLRGFRYREVGPRDAGDDRVAIGGATRITQRHELRYPITDFMKGRVFTDIAVLEEGPFEVNRPRIGSGVGLIVDIGPVVVEADFALRVLYRSKDRAQFFHLRIGSNF